METMNIFEQASRQKLTFSTSRGTISSEMLWDLPLTSKNGFDLDTLAKQVNSDLKATAEESFVVVSTNPAKAVLELKLEILKYIIADKQAAQSAARNKAAKAQERARLIEVLGQKQDEALLSLTPEQIQARLDALDD